MLILDKQKAIEQIVALTAHHEVAEAEAAMTEHARARQRVAVYERSRAAMQQGSEAATARMRRLVRLAMDGASP